MYFGLISIAVLSVSALYRSACHFFIHRCIEACRHQISTDLFRLYLFAKYQVNSKIHSAKLVASITTQTDQFIAGVFRPLVLFLAYGVIGLFLLCFLILYDWLISISLMLTFGSLYGAIYLYLNKTIVSIGKTATISNHKRVKAISEAAASNKVIKITNSEKFFLDRFVSSSKQFTSAGAKKTALTLIPVELVDFLIFSTIIGSLILYMIGPKGAQEDAFSSLIAYIAVFIFTAYRFKPVFMNVYNGITSMKFGEFLVEDLINLKRSFLRFENSQIVEKTLDKFYNLSLEKVSYRHENAHQYLFSDLNLTIYPNDIVGIVGPSGVGKSTLIDIVVGLLNASDGIVKINEKPLSFSARQSWLTRFGYVAQDTTILDDTVTNNIAFGIDHDKIDFSRVVKASKAAEVFDFINKLEKAFNTRLGENGSNISGGQKQRLSIARALYFEPTILVLDEPTSALDTETEAAIIDSIKKISGNTTIILITHNKNCLKICNKIVDLTDVENAKKF